MTDRVSGGAGTRPGQPGVTTSYCALDVPVRWVDSVLPPQQSQLPTVILLYSLLVPQIFLWKPEMTIPLMVVVLLGDEMNSDR